MMNKSVPKSGPNRNLVDMFPNDWNYYRLGDLKQESRYGLNESAIPRETEDDPRYIRVTDIKETGLGEEQKTVDCEVKQKDKLENGDLLFARSGATIGKVYIHKVDENYTHGGYTIKYRIGSDIVDPRLIYHYTQSKMVQDWFDRVSRGSTQANISTSELDDLVIPVPPLDEQERIVSLLSDVDSYIEKSSERVERLQDQKQAILQQVFDSEETDSILESGYSLNKNVSVIELEKIAEIQAGGTPDTSKEEYYDGNIPFVSISDMTSSGKYISDTPSNITKSGLENSTAVIASNSEVLLSIYASYGKLSLPQNEVSISQAIARLTIKEEYQSKISREYLYYVLQSMQKVYERMSAGTTQSNLSKGQVKKLRIPVPPLEEQQRTVSILSSVDDSIESAQNDVGNMRELKQGLLQEIFSC